MSKLGEIACDVSEFQTPLTAAYPRRIAIFRALFGASYVDRQFLANANAAAELYAAGKIDGAIIYHVWLPGAVRAQATKLHSLIGPTPPAWLAGLMIDVEHWGGTSYQINGDHSTEINTLAGYHAAYMGSFDSVIAYGNWGDLSAIYPGRDKRVRFIEANYSSTIPKRPGKIGQQYTDGTGRWSVPSGLPRSSPPFGGCDHNVFPGYTGKTLREALRPTVTTASAATHPLAVAKPKRKPAPRHAAPYYPRGKAFRLISPNRHHALVIDDNGTVTVHTDGKLAHTITGGK